MANLDPTPRDPRGTGPASSWGMVGLVIIAAVVALAVVMTLFGPTDTQQATYGLVALPPSSHTAPQPNP